MDFDRGGREKRDFPGKRDYRSKGIKAKNINLAQEVEIDGKDDQDVRVLWIWAQKEASKVS